jgi:hypothetical protein
MTPGINILQPRSSEATHENRQGKASELKILMSPLWPEAAYGNNTFDDRKNRQSPEGNGRD